MVDKLDQEITIGCIVVVAGGQGALQRMKVEEIGRMNKIACRQTMPDSCAQKMKLMWKSARESVVIDSLIKE